MRSNWKAPIFITVAALGSYILFNGIQMDPKPLPPPEVSPDEMQAAAVPPTTMQQDTHSRRMVKAGRYGKVHNPEDLTRFQSQTNISLLEEIRANWLNPPSDLPRNFTPFVKASQQETVNRLHDWVLQRFKKKKNGFFIECGAYDGVWLSNTLYLERDYNWTGLLVEADPEYYGKLMKRNRRAWTINACLGISPTPGKINITHEIGGDALSVISEIEPEYQKRNNTIQVEVQCFPLTSILAAVGQTLNVDYMSLDVEGAELKILQTVPWSYVYIKIITLEASGARVKPIKEFLKEQGYMYAGNANGPWINDHLFVHKLYLTQI